MKPWKRILLVMLVVLTILSLLLSACGPLDNVNRGRDNDNNNDKNKDKDHGSDKNINGNGNDNQEDGPQANKILICHKTGSTQNPYVLINVSENAAKNGHGKHAGDIIPAPEDSCPETSIATDVPAN